MFLFLALKKSILRIALSSTVELDSYLVCMFIDMVFDEGFIFLEPVPSISEVEFSLVDLV